MKVPLSGFQVWHAMRRSLVFGFLPIVLVMTACGSSSDGITPSVIQPGKALNWKTLTLPAAMTSGGQEPHFFFSKLNGNVAYACVTPATIRNDDTGAVMPGAHYTVWATFDAGATWQQRATLPAPVTFEGICQIDMESADGQSVLATVREGLGDTYVYFSHNGGGAWPPFAVGSLFRPLIVTSTLAYAILDNTKGVCALSHPGAGADPNITVDSTSRLCMSKDGLKTWTAIDSGLTASENTPEDLYYNATSGTLMVLTNASGTVGLGSNELYVTTDQGKTWQIRSVPGGILNLVVTPNGGTWRLCGQTITQSGTDTLNEVQCSEDGGVNWTDRPALNVETACAPCDNNYTGKSIRQMYLDAFLPDGTLLAAALASNTSGDIGAIDGTVNLYQLAPHATQWQALGPLPFHKYGWPWVYITPTGQMWTNSNYQVAMTTYPVG